MKDAVIFLLLAVGLILTAMRVQAAEGSDRPEGDLLKCQPQLERTDTFNKKNVERAIPCEVAANDVTQMDHKNVLKACREAVQQVGGKTCEDYNVGIKRCLEKSKAGTSYLSCAANAAYRFATGHEMAIRSSLKAGPKAEPTGRR